MAHLLRLLVFCCCGLLTQAWAHNLPSDQGALRIEGDTVFLLLPIPLPVLTGYDDNGDQRISEAELTRHRAALLVQIDQRIQLRSTAGDGRVVFDHLSLHRHGENTPSQQRLLLQRRMVWPGPVQALDLQLNLFDAGGPPLRLLAQRGDHHELAIFDTRHPHQRFFQGRWATFANFLAIGIEHILLGIDHLLFLLTLLVIGAGWRYWLGVVSSFTIAHSITLLLAADGWIGISGQIVEPLIALSIVGMALDNLWRKQHAVDGRIALVFACGLLHGLGFASALDEVGLNGSHRWFSLLGFNLGVELGQAIFVLALLSVLAAGKYLSSHNLYRRIAPALSLFAGGLGIWMLLQRVM